MKLLEKIQNLKIVDGLLVLGFLLVVLGIGMNFRDQFLNTDSAKLETKEVGVTTMSQVKTESEITVDVSGEVVNPGIYKLKSDLRIEDALVAAGGLSLKAD